MMVEFRKKWPNRIISSSGFEIQIEGNGTIKYIEEGNILVVNSEYLDNNKGILFYRDSLRKNTTLLPNNVFDEKAEIIEMNIISALKYVKINYEVI